MTITRRSLGAAFAIGLAAPAFAQAPAWPTRPVRLISPFAPGGPQDVPARYFVDYLTPRLGQPVVYDSRAGAGGALGMQHVATATDGPCAWLCPGPSRPRAATTAPHPPTRRPR